MGAALLALLLFAWAVDLTPLAALRLWGFDLAEAVRPEPAAPGQAPVAVLDIDDESLARIGQWPWPRGLLGLAVARLAERGTAVIALDLLLAEPDRRGVNDIALASAMARVPVVAGAAIPAGQPPSARQEPVVGRFATRGVPDLGDLPRASAVLRTLPVIEAASSGIGLLNLYPDLDGATRTVPGAVVVGEKLLPGLAIEAVRVAAGAANLILEVPTGYGPEGISVGGHLVPADAQGRLWIDSRHPGRIPVIPAHLLLGDGADAAALAAALSGRIVVIGVSASGVAPPLRTASDRVVTGSLFQALAIESILAGRVMARPPIMRLAEAGAAVAIGLAIVVASPWLGLPLLALVAAGLAVALAAAAAALSLGAGLLADASFPLLAGLVLTGQVALVRMREQILIRRQQAALLARQDAYMRRVVDASFDAIVTVDAQARILTANAGAARLFGIAPADLPGRRLDEMLPGFRAAALGDRPGSALDHAVRGNEVLAIAARHSDGSTRPAEMTIAATEIEQPVFVIVLRDIGARIGAEEAARRAGERLRDGIGRIAEGFALFGADRRLVVCNGRFAAMLGPAGAAASPGIRYEALMAAFATSPGAPVDAAGRADAWLAERAAAFAGSGAPRLQEHLDGRWFRVDERPTAEGGLVAIYSDVTELKLHEMEMADAMRRAETASAAKSEFLANMSHELRTPLNGVIGFADIMKQELFGPLGNAQYRAYADDIVGSGRKLLAMIENILEFSRAEQKPQAATGGRSRVAEVVAAVRRDLGPTALAQRIDLEADLDAGPAALAVDPAALYQVLQNLVSNAIKFSSAGTRVRIRSFIGGDGRPALSVADQGMGIPAELIGQLTQPFWQRQGALVRAHGGVGLGLAIVKSHADDLQGDLQFDSREGEGTTVTLRLPAACMQPSHTPEPDDQQGKRR
ncbi:MAG: CHASE2 domain-containing protein [Sneathiellaceae bacterium]